MIYLLHGGDVDKAREKLHVLLESLLTKRPDASLFKFDQDSFSESKLDELVGGRGLFEGRFLVTLDRVFENKEAKEYVLSMLKNFKESDNIFIILEEKLDKKTLTRLERVVEKGQEFKESETPKKHPDFNVFSLTDAFASRDRKKAWTLYRRALSHGMTPEELVGILFWQTKTMLLAGNSKSASAANLNPFVYKKSLSFSKHFKEGELEKISSDLVGFYHDGRRGLGELSVSLEKYLLEY